jgi:hypothetical protein
MIFVPPCPAWSFRRAPPFFGYHEGGVYVAFREVYLPTPFEVFGQSFEYRREDPSFDPLLEAPMTGLIGWVAFGKVLPGRSGAQYPEDAVQDVARIPPGSASPVFSPRWIRDKRLQHFPLLVGEVHAPLLPLKGHITEPLYPHFYIYEMASSKLTIECVVSCFFKLEI